MGRNRVPTDMFAESQTALELSAATRAAEARKRRHYSDISCRHLFTPIAIQTSGVFAPATAKFVHELGQLSRFALVSRKTCGQAYLFAPPP